MHKIKIGCWNYYMFKIISIVIFGIPVVSWATSVNIPGTNDVVEATLVTANTEEINGELSANNRSDYYLLIPDVTEEVMVTLDQYRAEMDIHVYKISSTNPRAKPLARSLPNDPGPISESIDDVIFWAREGDQYLIEIYGSGGIGPYRMTLRNDANESVSRSYSMNWLIHKIGTGTKYPRETCVALGAYGAEDKQYWLNEGWIDGGCSGAYVATCEIEVDNYTFFFTGTYISPEVTCDNMGGIYNDI